MAARIETPLHDRGLEPLPTNFHQAKITNSGEFYLGLILGEAVTRTLLNRTDVVFIPHVDEVDDYKATQITNL